jgi:multidrug resistance efflux pump
VRAPRDGTVLQVNIRPGEYAVPTATEYSILLGRTRELQLRADVDEDNAPRVKTGCEAIAFIKGSRHGSVKLRFVRIEPYIVPKRSLTGESSERVDTRVLQVIFRFERFEVPVYVGQQMDVFLNAQ